jgi:uncharacterized membrane protein YtjA (UPF0391 family)
MLNYPAIFFLIALGAAGMGFTGIATGSAETVRALAVIFFLGAVCSLPTHRRSRD